MPSLRSCFGANPTTGTHYMFVIDGNNGVAAFVLSGGSFHRPKSLCSRAICVSWKRGSGSMSVTIDQVATISWFQRNEFAGGYGR